MRRIIMIICLAVCALLLSADVYLNTQIAKEYRSEGSQPGTYFYPEETSPFLVDLYMCGDWEYYPDQLIYHSEEQENFDGGIGTFDPAAALDEVYDPQDVDVEYLAEDNTREETSYRSDKMRYITVPSGNMSDLYEHDASRVSSYRMVVTHLPATDDFDMLLSLQGLMYGDYEVYIDGHAVSAIVAPYGYPVYYFPVPESGRVEIVLQTRNTTSLLNIAPRISYKGTAMGDFDTYRILLLILISVLGTSFIILMILMFSPDRKHLYLPFFSGLCFTANYLLNNLWATGYQGSLTSVIPQYLIPHLSWFMLIAGIALMGWFCRKEYSDLTSMWLIRMSHILLLAALLVRIGKVTVLTAPFFAVLSDVMTALAILSLLIVSCIGVPRVSRSSFLCQIGFILMITGSITSVILMDYGFRNLFLYLQPVTIMLYMAFIFYNNKKDQTAILNRTRELLELEKRSSLMQTAMLSSQIQPHFLYNTLTSIQELCYSDPDEAANLIVTFSQYLRTNLDFMNYEDLIPFTRELEHIRNFMYIQNVRYQDAIDYQEEIRVTDFLVPPLTIEPIVENAVKHGIMKDTARGWISLQVFKKDESVHIIVKNNGTKFSETDLKTGHSLDNIQTRLKYLLNGTVEFHFEEESPETCVEVVIPPER